MTYVRTSGNIIEQVTFEHQAQAYLPQANPVSGTKYTVLNTTDYVRIILIGVCVEWTVQPTPLEIHITVDGQALNFSVTDPPTATWYYPIFNAISADNAQPLTGTATEACVRAFLLEGKSVKVEAETTGGTVQGLYCRVVYAKRTA